MSRWFLMNSFFALALLVCVNGQSETDLESVFGTPDSPSAGGGSPQAGSVGNQDFGPQLTLAGSQPQSGQADNGFHVVPGKPGAQDEFGGSRPQNAPGGLGSENSQGGHRPQIGPESPHGEGGAGCHESGGNWGHHHHDHRGHGHRGHGHGGHGHDGHGHGHHGPHRHHHDGPPRPNEQPNRSIESAEAV